MSRPDPLAHLSETELDELMTRYYKHERVADLPPATLATRVTELENQIVLGLTAKGLASRLDRKWSAAESLALEHSPQLRVRTKMDHP
ncbi:hypothetical protein ACFONG_18055 [Uliginosibacterium paludis]|uniref:Uncharacterized protein n=1 Tax=Uliginosibacterium paludis TaxID=1615952 RepID=A0ABV2CS94_9RHOO